MSKNKYPESLSELNNKDRALAGFTDESRDTLYERMQVAVFEVLDSLNEERQFDDDPYKISQEDAWEIARAVHAQFVKYDPIQNVRLFLAESGKRIPEKPGHATREVLELCLSLMLEELYEIASQCGPTVFNRFKDNVDSYQMKYQDVEGQLDMAEVLDGLVDMEYVQKNAVILWGFAGIYADAWNMVHGANMAKFQMTEEQVESTLQHLKELQPDNVFTAYKEKYGWVIKRDDGKIMKPIPFKAPDLNSLF
jgi:predicted HAD superfamily Cof-like phosphohydrolase